MAQIDSKLIPLQDKEGAVFRGGIINNSEPNVIPYSATPNAQNFRVNSGGISVRPGYYAFSSLTGTGERPFGLTNYTRNPSTNDRLLVGYKSDATHYLATIDSLGAQTNIVTGANITVETKMNFLQSGDAVYCMNGVDNYGKLSGTTYTTPATGVANLSPAFGVLFNNSGWVSGDADFPTTLYKSATNNLDSYTAAGSDSFTTGYPITGLGVNQQSLYVFTKNTIDVFNTNSINQVGATLVYQSKPLEATEGCANHNVIVSVGKGIFYISTSNRVRRINPNSFQMYDFTEISHRQGKGITKTMDSLSLDQTGWFGYTIPEKQLICWSVKSKGATYNDTVLVYNYEFDEWMVDTNKSFTMGTLLGAAPYTISAVNPTVFRDEFGDTDDDMPIQFRYDVKTLDFGEPTILKCLWQVRTFLGLNLNGKIYQNIYADGALVDQKLIDYRTIPQAVTGIGTKMIGTFPIGQEGYTEDLLYNTVIVRDKGYLRVKAKNFVISYVSYDLGSKCMLQRVEPMVEILPFLSTSHY